MKKISRRGWLRSLLLPSVVGWGNGWLLRDSAAKTSNTTGMRIEDLTYTYEDYLYRTPIKFGGSVVDRVTLLNVTCRVRAGNGRTAKGFGSMPLGNVWSFPSQQLSYASTLGAMKALAERIAKITSQYSESGHPIDINTALEPTYLKAAADISRETQLAEPIPKLCTLVTASPFDAALHDAFGKLCGRSCYLTYGPDFMSHDLSHYLGRDFKGELLDHFVQKSPKPHMPLYHLVGALDPLVESDIKKRINDGLPETLGEWIDYNGLTHIKIKLNGNDLRWDIERVIGVDQISRETQQRRNVDRWVYSLDFNEKCPNVDYLLEFLHELRDKSPAGYERIQYIEQPTARDLRTHRSNVMHEAAKLRPIVIDESLTDLESLMLAREMGYSGVALKACKGQSQSLLLAAAAQKYKMFLCVQDLTCPGASLIHSAGLAAHVPGVAAIEANSRQYVPTANKNWETKFPGIFVVKNGLMDTSQLNGPGLGAVE
jgi:L-alanine-DL-glutamate epimerase-like enolase superfamily enzyme